MKIFYDVDTQNDFMDPDGVLYVPNSELIKPNLKLLNDFAKQKGIPVFGSVDRHFGTSEYKSREGELKRNGGKFSDHCMDETDGQLKIEETDSDRDLFIEHLHDSMDVESQLDWAAKVNLITKGLYGNFHENFDRYLLRENPCFFEKQACDVFTNPAADYLFSLLAVEDKVFVPLISEAAVYGVATDWCVKAAVLGMQKRGIQCYVVEDAVKGIDEEASQLALEEMVAAGAKLTTTEEVIENGIR